MGKEGQPKNFDGLRKVQRNIARILAPAALLLAAACAKDSTPANATPGSSPAETSTPKAEFQVRDVYLPENCSDSYQTIKVNDIYDVAAAICGDQRAVIFRPHDVDGNPKENGSGAVFSMPGENNIDGWSNLRDPNDPDIGVRVKMVDGKITEAFLQKEIPLVEIENPQSFNTPPDFVMDGCEEHPHQIVKVDEDHSLEVVNCDDATIAILVINDEDGKPTQDYLSGGGGVGDSTGWNTLDASKTPNFGVRYYIHDKKIVSIGIEEGKPLQ